MDAATPTIEEVPWAHEAEEQPGDAVVCAVFDEGGSVITDQVPCLHNNQCIGNYVGCVDSYHCTGVDACTQTYICITDFRCVGEWHCPNDYNVAW